MARGSIRLLLALIVSCAFLVGLTYFAVGGMIFLIPLMMIPVGVGVWVTRAIMRAAGAATEEEDDPPPPPSLPTGRGDD